MRLVWGLWILLLAAFARADGIIERDGILPEMPSQRAFVDWRNGVETMIVESDFNGEPGSYVWYLPVPARPLSVEAIRPGALQTLQESIPIRVSRSHAASFTPFCLAGLLISVILISIRRRFRQRSTWTVITSAAAGLFYLLSVIIYPRVQPPWAASTGSGGDSVVGSFHVKIVTTVASNDDAVPEALRPMMDTLAREGWTIVRAELRKTGSGLATPHPLAIRFRTETPIYPMRLTGVGAKNPLYLDLFVSSAGNIECPPLRRVALRELYCSPSGIWVPTSHPDLVPYFRSGWQITRLSGVVSPHEMRRDFAITPTTWDGRVTVLTPEDARRESLNWEIGLFAGFALVLGFLAWRTSPVFVLGGSLVLGLVGGAYVYSSTIIYDAGPSHEGRGQPGMKRMVRVSEAYRAAEGGKTADECERLFREYVQSLSEADRPAEMAVPGGFALSRRADKLVVTFYDPYVLSKDFLLPK